ncbi:hypothetical protein [Pseudorhodoferax sp.]|uniref:hypothetical protein n=1 Tax=Pseudorhodoferax sp. TaxID=1993553 RepID=UPI002DD63EA3|nr:hypothetical protein [Pseudorhodoferax sp.]
MLSPHVRAELERCRALLDRIAVPPELDDLAFDLIDHLIALQDAGRLTPAFLMLSMKAFEDIAELQPVVAPLARIAAAQAHAEGHKEQKDRGGLPWVVSRYDALGA